MNEAYEVIFEGMAEVSRLNGESSKRYFHGPKHTGMVITAVEELAQLAGLSDKETVLLKMAAAWHDTEQRLGSGKNEEESARRAGLAMAQHGFGDADIKVVQNLIRATKVEWVGEVMHQEAEKGGRLEKLLADADLAAIGAGSADFIEMNLRLTAEVFKKPISALTPEEKLAWWKREVKFLTGRHFLSPEAEQLWGRELCGNLIVAQSFAEGFLGI